MSGDKQPQLHSLQQQTIEIKGQRRAGTPPALRPALCLATIMPRTRHRPVYSLLTCARASFPVPVPASWLYVIYNVVFPGQPGLSRYFADPGTHGFLLVFMIQTVEQE